ncbi:MAG: PD40 domain-containing protein [Acidobacteria bacterium]|nr:PD40 domain-containing protein [Acidobacteriota bacterium]
MSDTSAPVPRLVRFGVFEVDLRSGELRKSGARLNLQQQPLQLLSVLLEQPGELVTREELRKRLWPDDTFVDFDHGLNAAVKRLRDTLGDSADSPRFIETVPRRGYRFIAPASVPDWPAARAGRGAGPRRVRLERAIVGVGAAGAIALGIWTFLKTPVPGNAGANITSAHRSPGPLNRLTTGTDLNTEPTLSPDGEWVAYASDRSGEGHLDIWLQRLSGGEPVRLTRDPADEHEPTFSADGNRIAFRSEREGGGVYVIPAHSGGEARLLVRGGAHGPRFSPDGRWLAYSTGPGRFSTDKNSAFSSATYLIPSTGGESTRLLPHFASVAWPVWSPDSRLLLTARHGINDNQEWWVVAPDGQAPVKIDGVNLVTGSRFAVRPWSWLEGNRIVYSAALGGDSWNLWEVVIAPDTSSVSTEPKPLTTGADLQAHASIVRGTQLVFSNLTQTVNVWAVPVHADSGRAAGPAQRVTATSALQWSPSASEDGRRLVFRSDRLGIGGLWMRDLETDREDLLVSSRGAIGPVITADGSRVAYVDAERHWAIFVVPSSGGEPEKVCGDCGDSFVFVQDWSRDKTRILYLAGSPTEVFVLHLPSGRKTRALQRSPHSLWQAKFSPDDRWISVLEPLEAQGHTRLWVVPFRDGSVPDAHQWVGVTSGDDWDDKPRWSPDGNLLYFTSLRDGFHCLWAQRLRPDTKEPMGPAFHVQHFHSARLSMSNAGFVGLETAVARDKLFINLGELSGNIWTTRLQ